MARGFRLNSVLHRQSSQRAGADALSDHRFKVLLHRTRRRFRSVTARYETPSGDGPGPIRGRQRRSRCVATEEPNCGYPLNPLAKRIYDASSINLIALRVRMPFGDLSSSMPV
jgi:hypothetical protein